MLHCLPANSRGIRCIIILLSESLLGKSVLGLSSLVVTDTHYVCVSVRMTTTDTEGSFMVDRVVEIAAATSHHIQQLASTVAFCQRPLAAAQVKLWGWSWACCRWYPCPYKTPPLQYPFILAAWLIVNFIRGLGSVPLHYPFQYMF